MTDYTKITDYTTKDTNQDLIEGQDFDAEFAAVATMSTTKADKAIPVSANSVAGLNSAGNLYDSGVSVAALVDTAARQVQTGIVEGYVGASAPAGYLLCDGTQYPTASYADLFALVGYDFGGSGANFNVPDMRGRALVGLDNMGGTPADIITDANADINGGTAGAEDHTLTDVQMPLHDHGGTTGSDGVHTHPNSVTSFDGNQGGGGFNSAKNGPGTGSPSVAHTHTIDPSGSGQAHNNVQPSLFMNYIVKT